MNIIEVDESFAEIVGEIHSIAWKQAYENMLPIEYVIQDTAEKRRQECLDTLNRQRGQYYLANVNNINIGIMKTKIKSAEAVCEIDSIYILSEYQHKGYGKELLDYIKHKYRGYKIILWTLEINQAARLFYERNHFRLTEQTRVIDRGSVFIQVQYEAKV